MTIRNFFRTQRIGWREVCRFADGSVVVLEQNYYAVWALRVVLRDERQTAAGGLTGHRSVMAEGGPRGGRWRGSSRVLRPSPPSSGAQNATGYRQN